MNKGSCEKFLALLLLSAGNWERVAPRCPFLCEKCSALSILMTEAINWVVLRARRKSIEIVRADFLISA